MPMELLGDIIEDRVRNQRWFTARGLRILSENTGLPEETVAKLITLSCFYLCSGYSGWLLCNSILVVVPMMLIYVYPDEMPPIDNMLVFWMSAFVLTAYDPLLEDLPFYYNAKLYTLLFLLIEPSCLNEKLKKLLKRSSSSHGSHLKSSRNNSSSMHTTKKASAVCISPRREPEPAMVGSGEFNEPEEVVGKKSAETTDSADKKESADKTARKQTKLVELDTANRTRREPLGKSYSA